MSALLKEAINELVIRHGPSTTPVIEPAIVRLARKLPEGKGDLRGAKNYEEIAVRLKIALGRGERLSKAQARDGAWCLWETKVAIAAEPDLLDPFLAQLRALKHKASSRALAFSYLISFHAGGPGFAAVAEALRDLASVMGEPFEELHRTLQIFNEDQGPHLIGDAAFAERKSPAVILEEHGLRLQQVLAGGYVEPCARRVLQRAAEDQRLPALERLEFIQLVAVKSGTQKLNFPTHKDLVANALLRPHSGREVNKTIKDRTLDFLIALDGLGDPRTKSGNWVNIPEARDVAISWLTEQALRQFLDVVEEVNPNVNWRYRRKFWEAMHARGIISGAWVVLDGNGINEAYRRFGRNVRFGRFSSSSSGVQAGHAVLLLRIGAGLCVEWSFSGKCRFWADAQRSGAPQLYEQYYDAGELKTGERYAPIEEIIHLPHTGLNAWQHKAARRIASMTAERFNSRDYM
ncbi:EH signature domain-containing protein [Aminobacter aminovorans]|uniref:Zorya protein ZorC EH domain-containing protein n=1 Tax=Aminobacter aminovorans TaxID=83263 RepID=A0AAC9AQA1_AMIAI|nr:EH signature domain-containing protein [Aminobacter aminovorans]AMS40141.1 hypothetical protein AA2016_1206 [Aminobacter aminovorans]MBB3709868.1 hypothetical protein [Aminobacter aminovorans]